jgi:transposase-like protein
LYLDARYEEVRRAAFLTAVGVDEEGRRDVLGVSGSLSEREFRWSQFRSSLLEQGLCGVRLVMSDSRGGLCAARTSVFGRLPWQRCEFHLQHIAQGHVPKLEMRAEVASDIRTIFRAQHGVEADQLLTMAVKESESNTRKLSECMETNIPEELTVFSFSAAHRGVLRTTNGVVRPI